MPNSVADKSLWHTKMFTKGYSVFHAAASRKAVHADHYWPVLGPPASR